MTVKTWKHLNQTVTIKGLSSAQLGFGILIPLALFGRFPILAVVAVVVEIGLWKWLRYLQTNGDNNSKKDIDFRPIETIKVKQQSPVLIQDNLNYYELLMEEEND